MELKEVGVNTQNLESSAESVIVMWNRINDGNRSKITS